MGIIFHLSPGWHGYSPIRDGQTIDINAPRNARRKHGASEDADMNIALVLMLAIALAMNVAMFAHYLV